MTGQDDEDSGGTPGHAADPLPPARGASSTLGRTGVDPAITGEPPEEQALTAAHHRHRGAGPQ